MPPGSAATSGASADARLTGVSGWLIVFVLGQGVSALLNINTLKQAVLPFKPDMWALGDRFSVFRPLAALELAYAFLLVAGPLVGILLILAGKPQTPRYWQWFLGLTALIALVDLVAADRLHTQLKSQLGQQKRATIARQLAEAETRNIGVLTVGIVWGLYWARSRRVNNTFRQSFDSPIARPHTARSASSPPLSSSMGSESTAAEAGDASATFPFVEGEHKEVRVRCPWCAEWILKEARFCKHCRQPVLTPESTGLEPGG